MKHVVIGTLAHVDAGKTTLSESMLYLSGSIRKLGRVDHGDAFLDYDKQERSRGITIFSKQAICQWKDNEFTLLDTPGHVDFSSEMERTLQILDYAILIINGVDGVQTHTETIWKLLEHYQIPVFIFINKMDTAYLTKEELLTELRKRLDERCIDFTAPSDEMMEQAAMCDDELLEDYMEHTIINKSLLLAKIHERKVFPCYFGSALKRQGIETFLDGLSEFIVMHDYPEEFGAKVYKITRDENGNKLAHMKITGGSLKVKAKLIESEKVDQIRKYSGSKFTVVNEAIAGEVCAVKGLQNVYAGEGLGFEKKSEKPLLSSYMNYRMQLPEGCDAFTMLRNLKQLGEEDPQLHITYNERLKEIRVQMMGEIQTEILKNIISNRFNVDVSFDHGAISYRETILEPVEGVGHYEPLRHYAEVHLLLEPGDEGSGIQIASACPEDELDRHWQRLILSHLEEKEHLGVLTGSPITDMKITLLSGRAHQKHTEGGDFREATYRAVRQGLKSAKSIVLEPYFKFKLEVPTEYLSRAVFDVEQMNGSFVIDDTVNEMTVLSGSAPVAKMQNYQSDLVAYTKGKGKLACVMEGYKPCQNQDVIIADAGYDSETDIDNPTGSIFCSHGAGYFVPWHEVKKQMHVTTSYSKTEKRQQSAPTKEMKKLNDEDLDAIFIKTYGPGKRRLENNSKKAKEESVQGLLASVKRRPLCYLIDGYNIIHSWPELKELAADNLDAARSRLMQLMGDFQGYKQCLLILVFDAYKVSEGVGQMFKDHSIFVVYTDQAQTADMYIERATHKLSSDYRVVVATSDAMEQLIVSGQGAHRMSSRELLLEVEGLRKRRQQEFEESQRKGYNQPLEKIRDLYNDELKKSD